MAFAQAAKDAVTQALPETPVSRISSLNEMVSDSVSSRRVPMLVLSSFAALALILAAVGIAGVVSYGVAQRTQEIGIRMAFGANPPDVVRMMVGASMKWALAGVAAGIAYAFAATRLLAGLLYGVKSGDPFVMTAVAVLLPRSPSPPAIFPHAEPLASIPWSPCVANKPLRRAPAKPRRAGANQLQGTTDRNRCNHLFFKHSHPHSDFRPYSVFNQ